MHTLPGALRLPGSIVVIGAFDGVHVGHQKVIGGAVRASRSLDLPAVVYTFDPPPKALFSGAKVLTDIDEKLRRLSLLAPDYAIVASFDRDYATRPSGGFYHRTNVAQPDRALGRRGFPIWRRTSRRCRVAGATL